MESETILAGMAPNGDEPNSRASWSAAREEARCALLAWYDAPTEAKSEAFAVYRAAADREDAAAAAFMGAQMGGRPPGRRPSAAAAGH